MVNFSFFIIALGGIIGGIVGNPFDLVMTRMAYDKRQPPEKRKGYKRVIGCARSLMKEEGCSVFLRGLSATIPRAIALTMCQVILLSLLFA